MCGHAMSLVGSGIGFGALGITLLGFGVWRVERRLVCSVLLGALGLFGFVIAPSLGVPTAQRAGYPTTISEIAVGVLLLVPVVTRRLRDRPVQP